MELQGISIEKGSVFFFLLGRKLSPFNSLLSNKNSLAKIQREPTKLLFDSSKRRRVLLVNSLEKFSSSCFIEEVSHNKDSLQRQDSSISNSCKKYANLVVYPCCMFSIFWFSKTNLMAQGDYSFPLGIRFLQGCAFLMLG